MKFRKRSLCFSSVGKRRLLLSFDFRAVALTLIRAYSRDARSLAPGTGLRASPMPIRVRKRTPISLVREGIR
jgi:hypothetical protein